MPARARGGRRVGRRSVATGRAPLLALPKHGVEEREHLLRLALLFDDGSRAVVCARGLRRGRVDCGAAERAGVVLEYNHQHIISPPRCTPARPQPTIDSQLFAHRAHTTCPTGVHGSTRTPSAPSSPKKLSDASAYSSSVSMAARLSRQTGHASGPVVGAAGRARAAMNSGRAPRLQKGGCQRRVGRAGMGVWVTAWPTAYGLRTCGAGARTARRTGSRPR